MTDERLTALGVMKDELKKILETDPTSPSLVMMITLIEEVEQAYAPTEDGIDDACELLERFGYLVTPGPATARLIEAAGLAPNGHETAAEDEQQ